MDSKNCEFEVLKFADKIIGDSFYIADGDHHVYLLKDGTIVSLIPNIAMGYWETRELATSFLEKWRNVNED